MLTFSSSSTTKALSFYANGRRNIIAKLWTYLDFEAIDTEVLVDEANEKEEATVVAVEGDGATEGGPTDEGHVDEVVIAP